MINGKATIVVVVTSVVVGVKLHLTSKNSATLLGLLIVTELLGL